MRKRLLFLIALVIVSSVAFASATYAAFSKQYNPEVTDLVFGVATQENMMISESGESGTFKDKIPFSELISNSITLKPVDGIVTENSIVMEKDNAPVVEDKNYIKFTLYFTGSNDMDVYLKGSTGGSVVDIVKNDNSSFTHEQKEKIVDSLRIGFLAYSTREIPTGPDTVETSYHPLYTNIYSVNTKEDANYEAHRNYIDIQYMIKGSEKIGVSDLSNCVTCIEYDNERDLEFFNIKCREEFLELKEGQFMVFFPTDAHKPSITLDKKEVVKKVVVKVAV